MLEGEEFAGFFGARSGCRPARYNDTDVVLFSGFRQAL